MNTELLEALTILEQEKDISKETLLDAIENSLDLTHVKIHFGKADNIKVVMNRETCDYSVFAEKTVVEEVEDDVMEISLANAKMIDQNLSSAILFRFRWSQRNLDDCNTECKELNSSENP